MSDDIFDLSEFHLTHPSGKPYAMFDPQKDGEFKKLEKLLEIKGVEKLCRQEGVAILEKDQEFDTAVPYHWHPIYTASLVGAQGRTLRLEGDATVYVLFQIYLKDEHYSSMWMAFICPPGSGVLCRALLQDARDGPWVDVPARQLVVRSSAGSTGASSR